MAIGTVKFFNNDRGYGFITNEEGGKDAFVHISAVERSGMTSLRELLLQDTKVTEAGIADLNKVLPELRITK